MANETSDRCPACRTGDVISITMTVSGSQIQFSTCHECEAKWWVKDGEQVPLASVLGSVSSR